MSDNRGNWTSASAAEYDALCPGRHLAQLGIPNQSTSEAAESGTRIHAALADGNTDNLNTEELDTYTKCTGLEIVFLEAWIDQSLKQPEEIKEKRLWYEFGNLRHSGQPDVAYVQNNRALVIDYKCGRNEVTGNPSNLQLRDLACLVAHQCGVDEVTVAIVQPWAPEQPPCVYGPGDLAEALNRMEERIAVSNDEKSPRIPGEAQCKYCRAKGVCPEFIAAGLPVPLNPVPSPETVTIAVQNLDNSRLGAFLALSRLASDVAESEVRKRLGGGVAVDGWSFKPGRTTEKITDPQEVFNRFVAIGGNTEDFLQTVTVGKTKLKEAVKSVTEMKGKMLEAKLESLLEGVTESKTSDPILTHESKRLAANRT